LSKEPHASFIEPQWTFFSTSVYTVYRDEDISGYYDYHQPKDEDIRLCIQE